MNERAIIHECLDDACEMTTTLESLLDWLSSDEIVDWFVRDYFGGDYDCIRSTLSEEEADYIIDYYECHCE